MNQFQYSENQNDLDIQVDTKVCLLDFKLALD